MKKKARGISRSKIRTEVSMCLPPCALCGLMGGKPRSAYSYVRECLGGTGTLLDRTGDARIGEGLERLALAVEDLCESGRVVVLPVGGRGRGLDRGGSMR